MSTRMLRDWTQSNKIDSVSTGAEIFFIRLIMKADDFGCFYADTRLLKANLFPLKLNRIREADITRWMAECQKTGLIVIYESKGKSYLQIIDYGQRKRQMLPKFPLPPTSCGQSADNKPPDVEVEGEGEEEVFKLIPKVEVAASPPSFKKLTEQEFYDSLAVFLKNYSKEMLRGFFNYWSEKDPKGKMRFQLQKTWELKKRLVTWNSKNFGNGTTANQKGVGTSEARVKAASEF